MEEETRLSESQLKILLALEENDALSYEQLAKVTNLSYDGVRGRVSELNKLGFNIQRLKEGRNTILIYDGISERDREDLHTPHSYGDMIKVRTKGIENYYGISTFLNDMRSKTSKHKKTPIPYSEDCGVLVLSDLHFGQIVKTKGEIVYDTAIAYERMKELTDRTITHMEEYGLTNLYIAMLGDMVDGDCIYKNHSFEVEKAAINQVQDVVSALVDMIKAITNEGIYVEIGAVRGNHGITNYKNLEQDNWDNVVYDMLNLVFKEEDMVVINHFADSEAKVDILDKQVILTHGNNLGDQIRTASGSKNFRGICAKHKLNDGDMMFVGHLHFFGIESDQDKTLVRNGALPNSSEYALKLNYYNKPMQTFMVFREEQQYPIILPIELEE